METANPINANALREEGERGTHKRTDAETLCPSAKSVNKPKKDGIFFSKQTIDMILKIPKKHRSDAMALLMFYHYTACWQRTNQPRASIAYIAEALGWKRNTVCAVRSVLLKLGLIETVRTTDRSTGRVTGHFVRLRYFQPMNHEAKPTVSQTHPVDLGYTNAYRSGTVKCLRADKLNVVREHIELLHSISGFKLRTGEEPPRTDKESPHYEQSDNGNSPPTHGATPPSPRVDTTLERIMGELMWGRVAPTCEPEPIPF